MARILIVEDEIRMRKGLQDNLDMKATNGFRQDGEEGQRRFRKCIRFDLARCDAAREIRFSMSVKKSAPEGDLSNPDVDCQREEIDRCWAWNWGLDDYITKPFSLRELLARIKAALRRSSGTIKDGALVTMGKLQINFNSYEAYAGDQNINMTHKEYEILKYFWQHRNETVSRDQLLNEVWGMTKALLPVRSIILF